jgi:hypothetical protein
MHYASIPDANWQELFAVALREQDPRLVADRFRSAKDAIMDHIEESFDSASLSERRMLLAALNTITEMERSLMPGDLRLSSVVRRVGHAA